MGELISFYVLAGVAVATALAMVLTRNAVHSALFLVLNLITVAIFYLLLNAPFVAMVQIAVYAGAVMVLFLFVIMMLGAERVGGAIGLRTQIPLAVGLGIVLVGGALFAFLQAPAGLAPAGSPPAPLGDPAAIGARLLTTHVLPFEITSILLLIAMVGVVVLARDLRSGG
ncbi:NADH-quinone oxidoreductase subunit J [Thermoflexus hugenholtzii]|uniref:NADH-quinone oxidoreductase subunit J n=1 Tax=Thermoflexus hugenholtzii JAD2 TaxID=877466 RepID=A0A212R2A0_9CHLR|nr:NADH-quinone oxidoreductase subunit J [Thermoflexus hugenholtzii]SNB66076.1 NADH dehydrogenase subunit J [Thermoflexus hugenholtzii JAD2]